MPTTINSGLVDTADPLSNELKIDMRDKITYLDVDTSQFSTILMKLPQEKAKSFKVEWMDDRFIPRTSALAASATSADTGLTVTTSTGSYFKAGDLVRNVSTGECYRVTATAASALTVVRAIGATAAASSASSATDGQLVIVGGSNAQGATLPTALITQRTANYNYTSITRNAARFTETALATEWYGGDLLESKEVFKKGVEHKADIENTLFFGARSYSASDPPRHTSGGLIEYISTNITNAAGTLSRATLNTFLESGMQYGSDKKVLFAAPRVCSVISQYLGDNWVRATPDEKLWGVKVEGLISNIYGTEIPVITKRQWGSYGAGSSGNYGSFAFLVDMANVQFAPLRPSALKRDRHARDADEQAVEFVAEHSLKVENEASHAVLKNVTAGT